MLTEISSPVVIVAMQAACDGDQQRCSFELQFVSPRSERDRERERPVLLPSGERDYGEEERSNIACGKKN